MDILVCDSGISKRHIGKVINIVDDNWEDKNGHGSHVIDVLQCMDDSLVIGNLKILDENKECSLDELLDALKKCLEIDTKVILLALAIDEDIECEELENIIIQLRKQNKIIISAVMNGSESSFPASYPEVIGVKMDLEHMKYSYVKSRKIQCQIPRVAIVCKGINNEYKVFSGNSILATIVSGIVAGYVKEGNKTMDSVEKYLEEYGAQKNKHKNEFWQQDERREEINEIIAKICENNGIVADENILSQLESENHMSKVMAEAESVGIHINKKSLLFIELLECYDNLIDYLLMQESGVEKNV